MKAFFGAGRPGTELKSGLAGELGDILD